MVQKSEHVKNPNSVQLDGRTSLENVNQGVPSPQCMIMDICHVQNQTFWDRNVSCFAILVSNDPLRQNHKLLPAKNNQAQSGRIQMLSGMMVLAHCKTTGTSLIIIYSFYYSNR